MSNDLPFAYYINRDDRPERREHMEKQLSRLGFRFVRYPAFVPSEIGRFHTPGALGNWISHQQLISMIGDVGEPAIIFEDDVVIKSVARIKDGINCLMNRNVEWVFFYFFGLKRSSEIVDRVRTRELHGYLVNPKWSKRIVRLLNERFVYLFKHGKRNAATYSGNYIGRVLQKHFPFYGMRPAIFQNRDAFGSDTGWKLLYK
jgi:GR25 family glycosyltransferase involved in LPS biosynthesis